MAGKLHNQVLALAGMFQSAFLVQRLAHEGRADSAAFHTSIQSVLAQDAPDVESIYGGVQGVRIGLELLTTKLTGKTQKSDMELARYVVSMVQLEASLRRQPQILDAIRKEIDAAQAQMKFFEQDADAQVVHPALVEKLAQLYTRTISLVAPRILVSGEQGHLATPAIAARVRAALLAGIRSAVLWRQLGGRRWQLLLSRHKIARTAAQLLA